MARQILILAKSISDANSYAKLVGLPRFSYRSVRGAGAIRGVRNAEVHVLPGFLRRPDRHAIVAALRGARTLEIFYVDPADFGDEPPELVPGGQIPVSNALESGTPPTDRELEVAYRYHALREAALQPTEEEAASAIEARAEAALADDSTAQQIDPEPEIVTPRPFTPEEQAALDAPKPTKPRRPRAPKAAPPADDFFA